MIFLVLSGKTFIFPENMILLFGHKMKDDVSQKNIWKYDVFFKYDIFSLGGKWKKMILIKKRLEIWYFLYICLGVRVLALLPWLK